MTQSAQMAKEKLVYLRQWVGDRVSISTVQDKQFEGTLTNIVFDGTRLMYVMVDDRICVNFDHIVEVRLQK